MLENGLAYCKYVLWNFWRIQESSSISCLYSLSNFTIDIQEYIDCLMARTACLVCWNTTVNGCCKKREKKAIMSCASSGHITKLKQSIFAFRYLWILQWNTLITKVPSMMSKQSKHRHLMFHSSVNKFPFFFIFCFFYHRQGLCYITILHLKSNVI